MKKIDLSLPNSITLLAALCGFLSLVLLMGGDMRAAIRLNLVAIALDFADGYIARKFHHTSELGKNLDSMADVVIYLLFDAVLAVKSAGAYMIAALVLGGLIMILGMLRLARFNEEGLIIKKDKMYYRGLSVAHFSVIFILFSAVLIMGGSSLVIPWLIVSVSMSFLMVSNLAVPKVTRPFTLGIILFFLSLVTFYI